MGVYLSSDIVMTVVYGYQELKVACYIYPVEPR